jgi:hypothetical protein
VSTGSSGGNASGNPGSTKPSTGDPASSATAPGGSSAILPSSAPASDTSSGDTSAVVDAVIADNIYSANIDPQTVAGLQSTDTIQVNFGNVSAKIPVSILKNNMVNGNSIKLTVNTPPKSAMSQAEIDQSAIETFNIDLENTSTGELIHQLGGSVSITVKLTDDLVQQIRQAGNVKFYYFNPSTNGVEDMNATFSLSTKTVTFSTVHFSTYLIAKAKDAQNGSHGGNPVPTLLVSFAAVIFCAACVTALVLYRKKGFAALKKM